MNFPEPGTAAGLYTSLKTDRQFFTDRAEENSAFSIPSVFPRIGRARGSDFIPPVSGVTARGVNNLTAKLLQILLPTSGNFFRFVPDRVARELMAEFAEDEKSEVEKSLQEMERDVQLEIETEAVRVTVTEEVQHLIIAGNVLQYQPEKGGLIMYPLSQYVVQRDRSDNLLRIIIEELVAPSTLSPELQALSGCGEESDSLEKSIPIYTHVKRVGKARFTSIQEINGNLIPGSEGRYSEEDLPWRALRWIKISGESYGRSHMEEYISTVKNVEYLTKAIVEFARVASRVVPLVKPHAVTNPKDINNAKNGEAVYGNPDDIGFMQLDKFHDFRTANDVLGSETRALQGIFLMNASVQRDAERVTAEEFRIMAAELEAALGGVFSILSRDLQLPFIKGVVRQMQARGVLPKMSKRLARHVKPTVLTGVDALGRQADLQRFAQAAEILRNTIGPDAIAQVADARKIVEFVLTNSGVNSDLVLKTEEQIKEEQEEAQRRALAQQAVQSGLGPAINAASANPGVAEAAADQIQQPEPEA